MKNLLSYCGLVDVRINASDKNLPVLPTFEDAFPLFYKYSIKLPLSRVKKTLKKLCEFSTLWAGHSDLAVQVNLCQKHLFSHQLTHNMTKDCSLIYQFST